MVSHSKEKGAQQIKINSNSSSHDTTCPFCAGKHPLAECLKINVQPHEAKIEFLKENGLYFGCLKMRHLSKNWKRRMKCQSCQGNHPNMLHIDRPPKPVTNMHKAVPHNIAAKKPEETSISSALVSLGEKEASGAGRDCILPIVPVL